MSNRFTTDEIRSNWNSIKGARIASPIVPTGGGTFVGGAEYISVPDWVVITDDPSANRSKRVSL